MIIQTAFKNSSGTAIEGVTVAAAPTATQLVGPQSVVRHSAIYVGVQNTDGSQTLNAWVESGPTLTGPWRASGWTALTEVGAGNFADGQLDVTGMRCVRVMGTASGAGLNAKVWCYFSEVTP